MKIEFRENSVVKVEDVVSCAIKLLKRERDRFKDAERADGWGSPKWPEDRNIWAKEIEELETVLSVFLSRFLYEQAYLQSYECVYFKINDGKIELHMDDCGLTTKNGALKNQGS